MNPRRHYHESFTVLFPWLFQNMSKGIGVFLGSVFLGHVARHLSGG